MCVVVVAVVYRVVVLLYVGNGDALPLAPFGRTDILLGLDACRYANATVFVLAVSTGEALRREEY